MCGGSPRLSHDLTDKSNPIQRGTRNAERETAWECRPAGKSFKRQGNERQRNGIQNSKTLKEIFAKGATHAERGALLRADEIRPSQRSLKGFTLRGIAFASHRTGGPSRLSAQYSSACCGREIPAEHLSHLEAVCDELQKRTANPSVGPHFHGFTPLAHPKAPLDRPAQLT